MATHILDDLDWRGAIAHSTDADALRAALDAGPVTFYCGFDPTHESLHFGNLVQLVTMRRLQLAGHDPIAVVGGATGLIGDPSGRSVERSLNEAAVVADWVEKIRVQVERYLDFSGPHAAQIVNNLDWTAPVSALDLLRDVGKHFSVNRMLDKESVKARLDGPGISFTEFSYQILQAFDYLELHRRHGCRLQTGGSDQWGNLTAGVDLIRRVTGETVHALATPLITKADGTKYGKTEGGTLFLSAAFTSPYAFYQYFLNQDDADIGTLLRIFSFRSHAEIEALEAETTQHPEARAAQQSLAAELTELVHGSVAASQAASASAALFGRGELGDLDAETLASAVTELPSAEVRGALPTITDLLVAAGLADSRTAARRTVADGGAYLNNQRVSDPELVPGDGDLLHGRWLVLRRGKRSLAAIERVS
ncbi:MAG TPA: tyrosine--tRNA ligase [Candidatus Limnocylindria bacterium]|jgi:tyrosyl-tRNA synthetase|nr:tyrosine--tRNA ligase [Candidatus Limnocylindria bacterium]